jgi:hypothetical protein
LRQRQLLIGNAKTPGRQELQLLFSGLKPGKLSLRLGALALQMPYCFYLNARTQRRGEQQLLFLGVTTRPMSSFAAWRLGVEIS